MTLGSRMTDRVQSELARSELASDKEHSLLCG